MQLFNKATRVRSNSLFYNSNHMAYIYTYRKISFKRFNL